MMWLTQFPQIFCVLAAITSWIYCITGLGNFGLVFARRIYSLSFLQTIEMGYYSGKRKLLWPATCVSFIFRSHFSLWLSSKYKLFSIKEICYFWFLIGCMWYLISGLNDKTPWRSSSYYCYYFIYLNYFSILL